MIRDVEKKNEMGGRPTKGGHPTADGGCWAKEKKKNEIGKG